MSKNFATAPLYLGIDGGGSHCRARIVNARGDILGEGQADAANLGLGLDRAYAAVLKATSAAASGAGLPGDDFHNLHAGMGLAGYVTRDKKQAIHTYTHPFASVIYDNDASVACLGAHQGADGGVLILGTGSVAQVRSAGKSETFGGWGFNISDQASGACVGRAALRAALWAADGMVKQTAMGKDIMQTFDNQADQMLEWSYTAEPKDYAQFAPLVFKYAAAKDVLAVSIIETAIKNVESLLLEIQRRGGRDICLLGGLADLYTDLLKPQFRDCLRPAKGDALQGAVILAGLKQPRVLQET